MPRKTPKIEITPEDKAILLRWAASRTLPRQTVDRAKMILGSEAGIPVKQIAKESNTYPNKVIYWRQRYIEFGLEGLHRTNLVQDVRQNMIKLFGTRC